MRICSSFLVLGLALFAGRHATAGSLLFQAHNPDGETIASIYTDLIPGNPVIPSPSPISNLSDPTHLFLTQQVQNEAIFSFGMQGLSGETFSFTRSLDSLALFTAEGSQGSAFKLFFEAFYTDPAGTHSPFKTVYIPGNPVIPGNPIFPQGSFSLDYTLQQDPPFTVGISIIDQNGDNLTFSAVPEPGSFTIMVSVAALLAGFGWQRRWRGPRQ